MMSICVSLTEVTEQREACTWPMCCTLADKAMDRNQTPPFKTQTCASLSEDLTVFHVVMVHSGQWGTGYPGKYMYFSVFCAPKKLTHGLHSSVV